MMEWVNEAGSWMKHRAIQQYTELPFIIVTKHFSTGDEVNA